MYVCLVNLYLFVEGRCVGFKLIVIYIYFINIKIKIIVVSRFKYFILVGLVFR